MKKFIAYLLLGLTYFLPLNLISSPVNINSNFTKLYVSTNIEYFKDKDDVVSISNIYTADLLWKNIHKKYINFGTGSGTYWFRFKINNNLKKELYLTFRGNGLYYLYVYLPLNNNKYKCYKIGTAQNFSSKIRTRFPSLKFPVNLHNNKYIYVKTYNLTVLFFTPLLVNEPTFISNISKDYIIFWAYVGIIVLVIISFIFLFIKFKDYMYVVFSLYVFGWLFFNFAQSGFGRLFIWGDNKFMNLYSILIAGNIVGWSSGLFYKFFLNTKDKYPIINKILTYGIVIPVLSLSVFLFFFPLHTLFLILNTQSIVLVTFYMSLLIYLIMKRKEIAAKYLLIGMSNIIITNYVLVLMAQGVFFSQTFLDFSSVFANLWLLIFFIIAIIVRQKNLEKTIKLLESNMKLLQFSVEKSIVGALWTNEKGEILYLNKASSNILKSNYFKLLKSSIETVLLQQNNIKWKEYWRELKKKEYKEDEFFLRYNDKIFYLSTTANYISFNNREYAFIYIQDITGKKEAELEINRHRENLFVTLNSIGDAVIATDDKGIVTLMNPVAEKLTGWSKEEAIGHPLSNIFHIINYDTREKVENPVEKVLASGKIIGLANHTVLISREGEEYQIADSGAPIKLNNEIIGVVLVFRDVTEEYQREEQLRQKEKMDAIGQLAGGIAHDFNNMLGAIMNSAELVLLSLGEDINEDVKHYVNTIVKTSERAAHLTKQLLIFSRSSKLEFFTFDVGKIVKETVEILSRTISKKIELKLDIKYKGYVYGDPVQIETALINLGINARDAMKDGGILTLRVEKEILSDEIKKQNALNVETNSFIKISVTDTGVGIKQEIIDKIFDPFFTTKNKGEGTGIGLATVKRIVNKHSGFVTVDSNLGKGTTFNVYLPEYELNKSKESIKENEVIRTGKGFIIAAEDEAVLRDVLAKMLTKLGYENKIFKDGIELLEYYKNNYSDVDLVLLDIIMPKAYGTEIFFEIVKINPEQKIVFMSGFNKDINIKEFKKKGLSGFLQKPYTLKKLSELISQIIK